MKRITNEIKMHYQKERTDRAFYIKHGYFPTWAEEHRHNPDNGIKAYSTPAKWAAYQSNQIDRTKAAELATVRAWKDSDKHEAEKLAKLQAVQVAPVLGSLNISVEWKRSKTWGANPTATITAYSTNGGYIGEYTGTASGCGYDKESAAVASALNQCYSVLQVLYIAEENRLKMRRKAEEKTRRQIIGYGSGYDVLPGFEGGVGVSCFETIFKNCGYKFHRSGTGKMFDCYTVTR